MLVADGIDSISDLSDELANAGDAFDGLGQAAGMAERQTDTLQGGLSKLTAQAQDLGIEFYQSIQEPLKDVVKKATGYMDERPWHFPRAALAAWWERWAVSWRCGYRDSQRRADNN